MFHLQVLHGTHKRKKRRYMAGTGQKRGWQEDWSNQSTATHTQKACLHLTTHISCPCVPPGAQAYMSAAATLLRPVRKDYCVKERVALSPRSPAFRTRNNGVCYYPQVVFPSQEGRMGSHAPGCRSQADDRLHGCPC